MSAVAIKPSPLRRAPAAKRVLSRPARRRKRNNALLGVLAWFCGLVFFAPIAWMVFVSFHKEVHAAVSPPNLTAPMTVEQYTNIFERNISPYMLNSLIAAGFSTLLVIALAVPAAYATAVKPIKAVKGTLTWVLSTKFLPLIAALLPLYLVFKELGLLDNIWALVIFYTGMNLPVAIWMMHSFLSEIPPDVMAAAEVDGAGLPTILMRIVLPLALPGIAATALIAFIFAWNEFMFALSLTGTKASTAPVYLVSFITSEGLFIAQLSAASLVVSIPVVIAGWVAQDRLVQGLSLGAVK
ncbi:MAG: carbohydrate ABC transporter permease [Bifidobacteriaceae bacterium]|jgi:sorbitol/mannitol transport system permease protein|nr:carbohydrate ABC transporter permease [Bifidobacteriaceae bacterium]